MKRLRLGGLLFCILIVPISSVAGQKPPPLPKELPPYGPLKPFSSPKVKVETLSNGLTLWLVPRPGFPKIAFALAVRGGMAADPKARPGLAELLVATLDQGSKTRNAKQIAEEIQAAGGDLSGTAQPDAIVVTTAVLATKAEVALSVLADVFQNATFPESEVDLAKRNAADGLRAQEAEPSFLARRALAKAIFGEHPYSVVSATQDSIVKTTAAELRREYARRLRPDQMLLVAVGDFDPVPLTASIGKRFGNWGAPKEAAVSAVPKPPRDNPHCVFFVQRPGSVQTTFSLGAFGPAEGESDYAAAQVANAIYGGMFGSRLINNIREDKGYTYSPGALLQTRRESGLFQTRADVRNDVTGATLNEINYELNRMATTAPTEEEVTRAQRYLIGTRATSLQAQESLARQLATLWIFGLPPEELGRQSQKIQKVTAKDVEAVGKKYFAASRETIVTVGEEKIIKEQLAPLGVPVNAAPQQRSDK